jgi:hypothetical protein
MRISNEAAMRELINKKPADQPVKDFCQEHQIGEAKYYYWASKLKRQSIPIAGTDNRGFIPLKINGGLEEGLPLAKIVLNNGNSITVYSLMALNVLRDLL